MEDKDELIVYSIEYGLTKKTLNNKNFIEDIDKLFIAKKTRRDSRAVSRKISIDKNERKTKGNKDNNDDDDDEENDDKNEQNEEEEQYDNNEENVEEKKDRKSVV